MTVTWSLRGFDRRTEFVGFEVDIPERLLDVVRGIVPPREDDPTFVDPLEIAADQAVRLGAALGVTIDLDRFDYFVESQEDPYVVAAKVEAMRARA